MLKDSENSSSQDAKVEENIDDAKEEDENYDNDDLESSHEFMFMDGMYEMKLVAFLVQVFQLNLLLRIALTTDYEYFDMSWNTVLGMAFASLHYAMSLPDSLSVGIRHEMAKSEVLSETIKFTEGYECIKFRLVKAFLNGLFSWLMCLFFAVTYLVIKVMNREFAKIISGIMELAIIITTTICLVFVSNQQDNLLDILVNFAGIMIVLEFDEVVGKAFKSELKTSAKKKDTEFHLLEPSVEFGLMIWMVILLVWVRIITKRSADGEPSEV